MVAKYMKLKQFFLMLAAALIAPVFLVTTQYVDSRPQSTEDQTARLSTELWKLQGQFSLQDVALTVNARRVWEMHDCNCWGRTQPDVGIIEIMDIRDMPQAIPWSARAAFQNTILQHEVMHVKLTNLGVPGPVQDTLIEGLQPAMIRP